MKLSKMLMHLNQPAPILQEIGIKKGVLTLTIKVGDKTVDIEIPDIEVTE